MHSLVVLFLTFFAVFSAGAHSATNKDKSSIILPLNEWASQRVLSRVVGNMIQQLNIPVQYQEIGVADQWGALRRGMVHIQIEVWQPSMAKPFEQMVDKGYISDLGTHKAVVREEWWYPDYVSDFCPDLPSWQGLNKCAAIFSANYQSNKGVYYTGPWDYGDAELIRALELNFVIERLKDDKALWRELARANETSRPIVLLNWTPNWTDARIEGQFVEFPPYTPECESDPQWGINKFLTKDCANPKNGWLKKAAWPELKFKWPCVYKLVKNIDLNKSMISEAAALVIADGHDEARAASLWMTKFERQWRSWVPQSCGR